MTTFFHVLERVVVRISLTKENECKKVLRTTDKMEFLSLRIKYIVTLSVETKRFYGVLHSHSF